MEKPNTRKGRRAISLFLDLACVAFATSVVMDAYLWFVTGYQIPSWTIAAMSFMFILLLQLLKKVVFNG